MIVNTCWRFSITEGEINVDLLVVLYTTLSFY